MDKYEWFKKFADELNRRTGIDTNELDQDYFVANYYPQPVNDAVTDHINKLREVDPGFPES